MNEDVASKKTLMFNRTAFALDLGLHLATFNVSGLIGKILNKSYT